MSRLLAACAALASGVALLSAASPAFAQVDSVRLGVMDHNIKVTDGKNANKESGVNINGELRFASPGFLAWAGSPHPYLMASVNTDGNTSFAAVGLEWDFRLSDRWSFEPGFGYALHDGEVNNPFPAGTQAAVDFSQTRVLLGSEDLFRTSLALTYRVTGNFALQGLYEHLSHGQVLGSGRNQGLDEIGVRAVWNFQ